MSFSWSRVFNQIVASSSTRTFQRTFEIIQANVSSLQRFRDPAALFDAMHRPGLGPEGKNGILRDLIGAAQQDQSLRPAILTILLLCLWPGLDAAYARLARHHPRPRDELPSDLLDRATRGLLRMDLSQVNAVAATLILNAERDIRRELMRHKIVETRGRAILADIIAVSPTSTNMALPGELRAMTTCLGANEALIVFRIAVEGCTRADVARELGISEDAVSKRYQRALGKVRELMATS